MPPAYHSRLFMQQRPFLNKESRGTRMPKATVKAQRRRRPKSLPKSYSLPTISQFGQYYSKTVGRALDVLDCFSDSQTALSLVEISQISGFPKSSLYRILLTLEGRGYICRNADGSYSPALKLLFGKLYERAEKIRQLVRPFLKELNNRFNETVSLAFLFEDKIQVIDTMETFQEIRVTNTIGRILPPHCSSLGKAITAFQDKDVIDRIFQVYGLYPRTERTIVDRLALLAEFEQIRQQGYALDREESIVGGCCFGAPLYDERQHVVASISISVPVIRITPEREAEMIQAIVDTSRQASAAIQSAAHGNMADTETRGM